MNETQLQDQVGSALHADPSAPAQNTLLPRATKDSIDLVRQNVPTELLALNAWVAGSREPRKKDGKSSKIPLNPRTGGNAESNEPTTWSSFEGAAAFAIRDPRAFGVGVNLLGHDYIGLDLDHVVCKTTGKVASAAAAFLAALAPTYTELSPSGDGLRLILRGGALPRPRREKRADAFGPGTALEVYDGSSKRYLTMTGRLVGDAQPIADLSPADAGLLLDALEPRRQTPAPSDSTYVSDREHDLARAPFALAVLGADYYDDYHRWCDIGMSLKDLGEDGLRLWIDWSRQSEKFDEHASRRRWPGFNGSRTIGSLFYEADRANRAWREAGPRTANAQAADETQPRPDTFSGRWLPVDATWLEQEPPPQRWLVKWPGQLGTLDDGLAARGTVALLGGAGGIGKTEVATGLAVATVTRTPWLGYFHIDDSVGKVLLLAAEEDEPQMRRTLHRLTRGLTASHREEVYQRLIVAPMHGRSVALLHKASSKGSPTPSAVVDELRARLEAGAGSDGWAAVIVGPLSRLAGVSTDGDNEAATALIQQLEKLTEVAGNPAVFVDCHTNAASREEGKRAKVRGATGLVDGPRLTLLMSKRNGFVELEIGKTNRAPDGKAPLRLERRGGILQVVGSVAAEDEEEARAARDTARLASFERKVSRAIEEVGKVTPKSISKEALVGIIGGNVSDTRRAIEVAAARSLENVGTVLRPRYVLPGTDAHVHAQKKEPKKTGRDRDPPTRPKPTKNRKGRDGRDGRGAEGAA